MAKKPNWSSKLARVIRDRHGTSIATRDDARRYILALPKLRQERATWQHAARLLMEGASAAKVTEQIERGCSSTAISH
jgi:hypothetical protein